MYTLSVTTLGSAQLGFQYKNQSDGQAMAERIDAAIADEAQTDPFVTITDDYGRRARIRIDEIAAYFGADLAESLVGQVEGTIIQKRAEANFANKMQNDPAMKLLSGVPQVRFQA